MPDIVSNLRQRRTEAGLSQGRLAERVGVSRQAIVAIEGQHQVPSTALALQLASALSCSVEDLFTLSHGPAISAVLAPGGESTRVALGLVNARWIAHRVPDGASPADGLLAPSAADEALVEPLRDPTDLEHNVLVTGCAPLLGLLSARLGQQFRDARATWVPSNSGRALDLLERGLVHLAGVHLVDVDTVSGHTAIANERFEESVTLVNLTRWRQGLVVAHGNPRAIWTVDDLCRSDVTFVRREAGAGAQRLVERLLGGASPSPGPTASGHADVAKLVRWGVADVGIAIEAVAIAEGLDFIPLAEERFDLFVPTAQLGTESVVRFLDQIDRPTFRAEAAHLPGYDLSTAGHATSTR